MVLQALNEYYETLCERGELSLPGWSDTFKVTFGLDLSDDGQLVRLIDLREKIQHNNKTVTLPKQMRVPAHCTRTSGISANFLCDNSSYMLGFDSKGYTEKTQQCFNANKDLHKRLLSSVVDPAAGAIRSFFEYWVPEEAVTHPLLSPFWDTIVSGITLIFFYKGSPVSEIKSIQEAWQTYFDTPNPFTPKGQCLITGRIAPIASIHPQIKGVKDAQATGAALVSFNAPSFCAYGHEQNFNAPICERAAFGYTTALNTLLADRAHCRVIGDTTIVCWSERGEKDYQDAFLAALFSQTAEQTQALSAALLSDFSVSGQIEWEGVLLDEDEQFYVLGISPNAARLSVRFFFKDRFGVMLKNIRQHYEDLDIIRPVFDTWEYLPFWKLLTETVNENSTKKEVAPALVEALLRSILTGTAYPSILINAVQQRILADKKMTRGRAAIIKAYYSRANIPFPREVLTVAGNRSSTNIAYSLGRLFSLYEHIQDNAYPDIEFGIKEKYFASASCRPASVMKLLTNLSVKHLSIIRRLSPSTAGFLKKTLGDYSRMIGCHYPVQLSLAEQGAFQLGYYFETQGLYISKNSIPMEE